MTVPHVQSPKFNPQHCTNPATVASPSNASMGKEKRGRSDVPGPLQIHSEFKATVSYIKILKISPPYTPQRSKHSLNSNFIKDDSKNIFLKYHIRSH